MICNVVLVSAVQQSESVINISPLFRIQFPRRSLQSIEASSLCHTVGSYCKLLSWWLECATNNKLSQLSAPGSLIKRT